MTDPDYGLVLTPPAQRAIAERLPETVAAAVLELLGSALVTNPRRVGREVRDGLGGVWAARRGTYRILYEINEDEHDVVVHTIEHRRDAYRPM